MHSMTYGGSDPAAYRASLEKQYTVSLDADPINSMGVTALSTKSAALAFFHEHVMAVSDSRGVKIRVQEGDNVTVHTIKARVEHYVAD